MSNLSVGKNEFDKEVFAVSHAGIRKVKGSSTLYELQLNDHYFQISDDMLESLVSVIKLGDNVGLSVG